MSLPSLRAACLALPLALAFSGCVSLHGRHATDDTRPAANSAAAMKEAPAVQGTYYTSAPISLVRFASGAPDRSGKRNVARSQIAAGSPGVVLGSGEGWIAVSFSPGSYLYFTKVEDTLDGSRLNDSRVAGRYYLYLGDWDGRAGTVKLGGTEWLAVDGSREVYLVAEQASARSRGLSSRWLDEKR